MLKFRVQVSALAIEFHSRYKPFELKTILLSNGRIRKSRQGDLGNSVTLKFSTLIMRFNIK